MASSNVSFLTTLFMSTIFLSMLTQNIVTSRKITTSSSLIKVACSDKDINIDSNLCVQVLQSLPQVVSAKNLFELSIRIMESGLSNTTDTLTYVEKKLNTSGIGPDLKDALKECKTSYDSVTSLFNSSLSDVRNYKEYESASYELLLASTDNIKPCLEIMASKRIKDEVISNGNKVVPIFGFSACNVVERLQQNDSETPPPTPTPAP